MQLESLDTKYKISQREDSFTFCFTFCENNSIKKITGLAPDNDSISSFQRMKIASLESEGWRRMRLMTVSEAGHAAAGDSGAS